MFKAVFFDLDETLIDASACHKEANRQVFEKFNIDYGKILEKTKSFDFFGMRMVEILKTMRDSIGIKEETLPIKTLTRDREDIFITLVVRKARLLPDAAKALTYVKSKQKILAVASSGTRKYIKTALKKFDLQKLVDFIIGEEDVLRGKPNPECYLTSYALAAKIIPLKKEECLVVEDAPNGVLAAKSAGLKVCYVPFIKKPPPTGVDYEIRNLNEFLDIPL